MNIKAPKDFWAGLMFMGFGLGFAIVARSYPMGTAIKMGPAYFPTILGLLLATLGVVLLLRSLAVSGEKVPSLHFGPMAILVAGLVLFGLMLRPIGLVAATLTLVIVSTFAGGRPNAKSVLLLAIFLAAFSALVFQYGLGLPLKLWPWE